MDAVVLFSGGLDSAVLLAKALEHNLKVLALSIDYRQRHIFELTCAEKLAKRFGVPWKKITLDPEVFEGVPLTGTSIVPPGMEGGVSKAYVPARNTLFLSYALGFAEKLGAPEIHIGANAHDRTGFPDTRPDYLETFDRLIEISTLGKVRLVAPLQDLTKAQIAAEGRRLGVPLELTSSCYCPDPEGVPCQNCDACKLRKTI